MPNGPIPWTQERLLSRLEGTNDPESCWTWTGASYKGYGNILARGTSWKAHRLAYTLFIGPIPDGMDICHRCDNPPCCNPAHLFAGTTKENVRDSMEKGRFNIKRGERHGMAKLTEDTVRQIRALYDAGTMSNLAIAERLGVHRQRVTSIGTRKTWRHLP